MKYYNMDVTSNGSVRPKVAKNGKWVRADVAHELYKALKNLTQLTYEDVMTPEDRDEAEKALEYARHR